MTLKKFRVRFVKSAQMTLMYDSEITVEAENFMDAFTKAKLALFHERGFESGEIAREEFDLLQIRKVRQAV